MRMVDVRCPVCATTREVLIRNPDQPTLPECCGQPMTRVNARAAAVQGDDIPGGLWIEHGLCHEDGTPRRFDSHSAIKRAAAEKGLLRWSDVYEERKTAPAKERLAWIAGSAHARREKRDRDEARFYDPRRGRR